MDYLQAVRGEGVRDSLEKYRTDAEMEKSGQAPVNFDFDLFVNLEAQGKDEMV